MGTERVFNGIEQRLADGRPDDDDLSAVLAVVGCQGQTEFDIPYGVANGARTVRWLFQCVHHDLFEHPWVAPNGQLPRNRSEDPVRVFDAGLDARHIVHREVDLLHVPPTAFRA